MSILDWFRPTRESVLRAEAARLRREANWTAKTDWYDGKPDSRREAVAKLLAAADEVEAEAEVEAARLELGL